MKMFAFKKKCNFLDGRHNWTTGTAQFGVPGDFSWEIAAEKEELYQIKWYVIITWLHVNSHLQI
jgi:hypothetical protein